jgi:hypothetical protein
VHGHFWELSIHEKSLADARVLAKDMAKAVFDNLLIVSLLPLGVVKGGKCVNAALNVKLILLILDE